MVVDREQSPVSRELIRPVSGKTTPALGCEVSRELGDQGCTAIK
jgi:hypothetical protein